MIRLKILAAIFSVAIAITEELSLFDTTADEPKQKNELIAEVNPPLAPEPEEPEHTTPPPPAFNVVASVYFPEPNQTDSTPFITADGSKINKRNPKSHRWIAVSRDLHAKWGGEIEFGDSLMVTGVSEEMDGVYVVRDLMNRRMRNKIDILVGRNDRIMGLWEDVQIAKLD